MNFRKLARAVAVFILLNVVTSYASVYFVERYVEREAGKHLRNLAQAATVFGVNVQFERVKFDFWKRSLGVHQIHVTMKDQAGALNIAGFIIEDLDYLFMVKAALKQADPAKEFPATMGFRIAGVEVPLEGFPFMEPLVEMGYKKAYLDFSSGYELDNGKEIFKFKARAAGHSMGEFTLRAELGNFNMPVVLEGLRAKNYLPLTMTSLRGFELKFTDHSLMSRLNWYMYQKQKTTLAHTFKLFRQSRPADYPQIMDSVQAFLDNPKSFALVAAPAQPVPVLQMVPLLVARHEELAQVTNMKLVANQ